MPVFAIAPTPNMRQQISIFPVLALCFLTLSACDTRRQAEAVAGYFWDAVEQGDLELIESLSTNTSDWALDEAIEPLLGGHATLNTEAATRGNGTLHIPTTLARRNPLSGWPPVDFDTVLVRASDGYRIDLSETLAAYQDGARAAAARRYEEAAQLLTSTLETAADGLVAQLEIARRQLQENLPEQAISLTRALRAQIDAALLEAGTGIESLLGEIADQVEVLQREIEALTPPEADAAGDAVPHSEDGVPEAEPRG